MIGGFPAIQLALDFVTAVADAMLADQAHAYVAEAAYRGGVLARTDVVHLLAMSALAGT